MRFLPFILSIAAALAIAFSSCNTSGCLENRNSVPLAGFYGSNGKGVSLDSVQITGLGMHEDKPLSKAGTPISQIYLPMRSTEQSTSWVFAYKWKDLDYPQLCDTVAFDYESTPYFASQECGVIFKYRITRLAHTSHLIDSIRLADSLITNIDIEQIKIFFRTNTQEPEEE